MKSEVTANYQKRIKDYVISYCPSEFFGRSIHGEVRSGYQHNQSRVIIFRIAQLPLTPALALFLETQENFSGLSGFARTVFEPVHSSSNHYQPMEYFPKTFFSEKEAFRANPKYMDEYVQKFLKVYAFFYNMRVAHGNISAHNIGITFDGKVKLMDFAPNPQVLPFQARAQSDLEEFRHCVAFILEKDSNFPSKFASFNLQSTFHWEHLFGLWHITSPLEPLYLPRKGFIHNIVTLLFKLSSSLEERETEPQLLVGLRLLMLKYMEEGKEELEEERKELEGTVGRLKDWNCDRMNGVLIGAVQDPSFYGLSPEERLVLICCLVPELNHEYAYFDVVEEFSSSENRRNQMLGDSLLDMYLFSIRKNLLPLK